MKKQDIIVDGVSISKDFIGSHKSEADFLEAMSHKTYAHLFEGENREAKLKEVYALGAPKEETKPADAPKPKSEKPAKGENL